MLCALADVVTFVKYDDGVLNFELKALSYRAVKKIVVGHEHELRLLDSRGLLVVRTEALFPADVFEFFNINRSPCHLSSFLVLLVKRTGLAKLVASFLQHVALSIVLQIGLLDILPVAVLC